MSTAKKPLFVLPDGTNLMFTFILVSSLFLLWGVCNGMIDVMDKHFQEELSLTKSQSAWVQFAHYLGYFLMSIPAGWLATKLGYKGGIIAGLLIVARGRILVHPRHPYQRHGPRGRVSPATAFVAFLAGVCVIATGLTFLETIANPYTTVLGDQRYAATRINLAQSCNGVGWIFGPIIGSMFFYSKDAAGQQHRQPDALHSLRGHRRRGDRARRHLLLRQRSRHQDRGRLPPGRQDAPDSRRAAPAQGDPPRTGLFAPAAQLAVLIGVCGMILWVILQTARLPRPATSTRSMWAWWRLRSRLTVLLLASTRRGITHHSIWSHPHFPSAALAQFFYVAAQAGIFSFFINYMTAEVPAIPPASHGRFGHAGCSRTGFGWFAARNGALAISDKGASNLASLGFVCFLVGRFTGAGLLKKFSAHKILGLYGLLNVLVTFLVFCKLGWLSVACVFLSYFFMSIMFPTIFALGIFGLGGGPRRRPAFIVMAIMGGAILPKLMGYVADKYDMSRGFIVPDGLLRFRGVLWLQLAEVQQGRIDGPGGYYRRSLERTGRGRLNACPTIADTRLAWVAQAVSPAAFEFRCRNIGATTVGRTPSSASDPQVARTASFRPFGARAPRSDAVKERLPRKPAGKAVMVIGTLPEMRLCNGVRRTLI